MICACVVLGLGCGGPGDGASSDDAGESGQAPVPGPSAEGWQQAFVEGGVGFGCDASFAELDGGTAPRVQIEDTTLFVGFEQIGDNQNPLVVRFDGDQQVYCARHESEGPDGRALGLTWDGGDHAYVVYTIVGGGSSLEGKGGWLPSYAPGGISGGGPKVSYVGRVSVSDGVLQSGTFVIAVKSDNTVNSHGPTAAPTVLETGEIQFLGESAHKPIDVDGQAMDCTDYPFTSKYLLSPDLGSVVCAECSNCVSSTPCE